MLKRLARKIRRKADRPGESQLPPSIARAGARRRVAIIRGQDNTRWTDFYHAMLTVPWPMFLASLALFFILLNSVFALIYMIDPHGIENARPGSFWDAFQFSVQTIASIGYGHLSPRGDYTNFVVLVEAFAGILNVALITGAVFARFSRPFARVLFSDVAVITTFDGLPTLMFRAANQRGNQILDANVMVTFVRQQNSREGHTMRRFEELKLVRSRSALFALSWTVMHAIDETSPLYGQTPETLNAMQAEVIALLSGTDETLADTVFARHSYRPHQIRWQHHYADILSVDDYGRRIVDLTRFHDTAPDAENFDR